MDADRKKETWDNLYKYVYKEENWNFWSLFNFDKHSGGYIELKQDIPWENIPKDYQFLKDFKNFKISGDLDFGTAKEKKYTKEFEKQAHKFPNFSLMPQTCGMNSKKGLKYHDRFNIFLSALNDYYLLNDKNRKEYLERNLLRCDQRTKDYSKCLCNYLNLFKDIYDYSKKIYLIDDKKFIDKIIEDGKKYYKVENNKVINNNISFNYDNYIDLAFEYWNKKKEYLKKCLPEDIYIKYINEDISDKKYT